MFIDYISTHLEEAVKFVEYCLVEFALAFCGICGGQYTFCLFTDAIEKSVDLLHKIVGCQSRSYLKLFKMLFPPRPVVGSLEIEWH